MRRKVITLAVVLAFGTLAVAAQEPSPIQIAIEGAQIGATGLTDPGSALLFGVVWEKVPGTVRLSSRAEIVPVSAGAAALDLGPELDPMRSVWAVVDLASGAYAAADTSPEEDPLVPGAVPAPTVAPDSQGLYSVLQARHQTVELVVARPGVGAWRHTASDGSLVDEDGAFDGSLAVNLAAALPIGVTPDTFTKVQDGDLVLGLDPYSGEAFVLEIEE